MKNFEQAFKWLMVDEGGYTNDPSDSGGATNFGITIGDYQKYINKSGTPNDVKHMTMAQAESIYRSKYWNALNCDSLQSGVDNAAFNYGVLAGIGRPRADLKKFADIKDVNKLIDAICDEMSHFLVTLATERPKDKKFLSGWMNRVKRLRQNSHSLASKPSATVGSVVATGTLGATAYLSQFWHSHEYLILGIGAATAVAIGLGVHYFLNKGK